MHQHPLPWMVPAPCLINYKTFLCMHFSPHNFPLLGVSSLGLPLPWFKEDLCCRKCPLAASCFVFYATSFLLILTVSTFLLMETIFSYTNMLAGRVLIFYNCGPFIETFYIQLNRRLGGTSLVVLWLRACLLTQAAWIWSLIQELRFHMPWASWTCAPQLESTQNSTQPNNK